MAVVFQLFCTEDLLKLNAAQLDDLRTTVGWALEHSPSVLETVKGRADQVFQQLTTRKPIQKGITPDPSKGMLLQLFSEEDLSLLNAQQLEILKMAISCAEVLSPEPLKVIKDEIHTLFTRYTGQCPKESDVYYGHI